VRRGGVEHARSSTSILLMFRGNVSQHCTASVPLHTTVGVQGVKMQEAIDGVLATGELVSVKGHQKKIIKFHQIFIKSAFKAELMKMPFTIKNKTTLIFIRFSSAWFSSNFISVFFCKIEKNLHKFPIATLISVKKALVPMTPRNYWPFKPKSKQVPQNKKRKLASNVYSARSLL
jgi:hypothetical protein